MKIQNLSIVVGSMLCNARCPYCVAKMTPKQGVGLIEPEVNWRNFEKACRLAQINNVTSILITGKGEPTLFPKQLTEFLKKLQKFNFPIIELQTNGLVFEREEYEKYLNEWYELGLTIISISITHYRKDKNKEIFIPKSEYINLEKVIDKLHKVGYSIRLSCTLFKGQVDSVEEIKEMIDKAREWKVEQLSLRKLSKPLNTECNEVSEWVVEHAISDNEYSKMINFLKTNGNRLMTISHGSVIYDLDGQNVCFTDALTIEPDTENLRQLIFFPDGHVKFDWQFRGATLI